MAPGALSLYLPSSLCASFTSYAAACQLLTQMAIRFLASPRLSSSVRVLKILGKSSDWPSLGQLSTLNQSAVTKRVKWKKHGRSFKSQGLELGEEKRKTFSQKKGDRCSQKKGKTACHSPLLPRMKANKAFKEGGK